MDGCVDGQAEEMKEGNVCAVLTNLFPCSLVLIIPWRAASFNIIEFITSSPKNVPLMSINLCYCVLN